VFDNLTIVYRDSYKDCNLLWSFIKRVQYDY